MFQAEVCHIHEYVGVAPQRPVTSWKRRNCVMRKYIFLFPALSLIIGACGFSQEVVLTEEQKEKIGLLCAEFGGLDQAYRNSINNRYFARCKKNNVLIELPHQITKDLAFRV